MATKTKETKGTLESLGPYTLQYCKRTDCSLVGSPAWYNSSTSWQNFDRISYETGKARGQTKNCKHVTFAADCFPVTGIRQYSSVYDLIYTEADWVGSALWSAPYLLSSLVPTSATIASFNAEAFDGMTPSFESDIQLTNFLLELSDFELLFKLGTKWVGRITDWRKLIRNIRSVGSLTLGKLFSASTKELAELHLTYAFGIKPFISDVKALHAALTRYEDSITSFLAKRGTPQVRHYRKVLQNDSGTDHVSSTNAVRDFSYNKKVVLHATMKYTYDCPDIITFRDKIRVLRDMLGLRFGLPQIWEAIPFSFVVDWFVRVQDFLNRNQEPLWPVKLTVMDYCVSWKCEVDVSGNITFTHALCGPDPATYPLGRCRQKLYHRQRQLPNSGTAFINPGQYGLNQLALSASLLRLNFFN